MVQWQQPNRDQKNIDTRLNRKPAFIPVKTLHARSVLGELSNKELINAVAPIKFNHMKFYVYYFAWKQNLYEKILSRNWRGQVFHRWLFQKIDLG